MPIASTTSLLDALRQHWLLDVKQLEDLKAIQRSYPDPKAFARKLIQQGWLTLYQANQLLNGKGQELVLGSYILLDRLGEGGMGQVFKARHRNLGRITAIKLIRKESLHDPHISKRFQREVQAAAQLNHPNIVHAYDADEVRGALLLAMEYIEGAQDLAQVVKKRGPLPVGTACEYIRQAALGLQHAYERGMVHRDIKPANLLLTADGHLVKLLDMGLARLDYISTDGDKSSTMTQEGLIMGTLDYIAPEQAVDSHTVDIRADLYSLGCTFYYLLAGRVPFPGGAMTEKLIKHQLHEPQPLATFRAEVPAKVVAVVRKLMAKNPGDRYQTPADVAAGLDSVSSNFVSSDFVSSPGSERPQAEGVERQSRAEGSQAVAEPKLSEETLASAFAYMARPEDTVALEPAQPRPAELKNRRWWMFGAVSGSLALVGLLVFLALSFTRSTDKKPSPKEEARVRNQPKNLPNNFTNSLGMRFVLIPPGTFLMGSPKEEEGRLDDEIQHKVTLTQGFYMGVHLVTQEQWQEIMGANPSFFKGGKNLPVEEVSWDDCQEFIKKLRKQESKPYRLPTEAEWEYACRAGTTTPFHLGQTISTDQANYDGTRTYGNGKKGAARAKTTPVGSFPPNAWGLYDTHGNVWQFCQDRYGNYPAQEVIDPQGPNTGISRVLRGGSWRNNPVYCRSASRNKFDPGLRNHDFGFRLCFYPD
jgi:formylglycine-generating enzyme required for sulfatase activity/tRNA A-37 threonylcarbamoyl transferase component Bud32